MRHCWCALGGRALVVIVEGWEGKSVRGSGVEGGVAWGSWVSDSAIGVGGTASTGVAIELCLVGGGLTYLHKVC